MTYEYGKDFQDKWRWQLKGENRTIIAIGKNGYNQRRDCLAAIEMVKNSANAEIIQLDHICVELT